MLSSANKLKRFTVLFAIILLILGCSDPEKKKTVHYNKGIQYAEKGDWNAAILEFSNAVQVDPKYADARYQLGLAYLEDGQLAKAVGELTRTIDLDPQNIDAQLKSGRIFLLAKKYDESREHSLNILEIDPKHVGALHLLSSIQFAEKHYEESLEIIDKAISINPKDVSLYLTKAYAEINLKKYAEAEKLFLKTIELAPGNMTFYKVLTGFYLDQQMEDNAEKIIRKMMETFPDSIQPYIYLTNLLIKQGKYEEAEENLKNAIEKESKGEVGVDILLGNYYKLLGRTEEAEMAYQKALIKSADPLDLRVNLADFYVEQGRFGDAAKELAPVFAEEENHPGANLVKAKLLIQNRKNLEALTILDELLIDNPRWGQAYFQKALSYLNRGEVELSLKSAYEAKKYLSNDSKVYTLLAELYFLKRDYDKAQQEAINGLQLKPTNFRAAILLGKSLIATKDYDRALNIFEEMEKVLPDNIEILHYKALTHLARNEIPQVKEICTEILADHPQFSPSLLILVNIALRERKMDVAMNLVKKQLEQVPENEQYLMLLGKLYTLTGQYDKAIVILEKIQGLDNENIESYLLLSQVYGKLGKIDEAISGYENLLMINPRSLKAHMALAALMMYKGDETKMREHYENALKLHPEFAPAANNLAWLMAEEAGGDLGEALRLALVAKEQSPENPYIADTLGWVHYKRKSYSLALSQFVQAADGLPDNLTFQYHLALALKANDKDEEARKTLVGVLKSGKEFPEKEEAEKLLQEMQ